MLVILVFSCVCCRLRNGSDRFVFSVVIGLCSILFSEVVLELRLLVRFSVG